MGWNELFSVGAHQRGVFAARDAPRFGVARSTFDARVVREGWRRPYPGVVLLPGGGSDRSTGAVAAALCLGAHATVTGASALLVFGVLDRPVSSTIDLVVANERRAPRLRGVRVARSRTLEPADREQLAGAAVARPPRAFLDLARHADPETLRAWLIDARQRRAIAIADVADRARRATSTPGRGKLLRACADVSASGADSRLVAEVERRLRVEGVRFDVPPRLVPTPNRTLHPDITLVGRPIAIEADGFGFHASRRELDLDQRKHNAYLLAGWTVLRITWSRLADDWDGFVADLRRALAVEDRVAH